MLPFYPSPAAFGIVRVPFRGARADDRCMRLIAIVSAVIGVLLIWAPPQADVPAPPRWTVG